DDARAEFVDEPALDRNEPRFGRNENRERDLNISAAPMKPRIDRVDEIRPAILEDGDHHHTDDAYAQVDPATAPPHGPGPCRRCGCAGSVADFSIGYRGRLLYGSNWREEPAEFVEVVMSRGQPSLRRPP